LPDIIRLIKLRWNRWAAHIALMEELKNADTILVRKPEKKRPFGRPRCRCDDNKGMDLKEIGWECVDWIHLSG